MKDNIKLTNLDITARLECHWCCSNVELFNVIGTYRNKFEEKGIICKECLEKYEKENVRIE